MTLTTTPSGVRSRTRLSADERRRQIITSATRLIAERGFRGLTLRDVAIECDITEAGVLHHVGSKDGLLIAVLEHRDAADRAALAEQLQIPVHLLQEDEPPAVSPVDIQTFCTAVVARNARQPEIVRLYAVLEAESLDAEHPAHDYFDRREERGLDRLARAARDAGATGEEAVTVARQTLAALDGLQLRWLRAPDVVDLVEEWSLMSRKLFA